jgi:hypothetical protein
LTSSSSDHAAGHFDRDGKEVSFNAPTRRVAASLLENDGAIGIAFANSRRVGFGCRHPAA